MIQVRGTLLDLSHGKHLHSGLDFPLTSDSCSSTRTEIEVFPYLDDCSTHYIRVDSRDASLIFTRNFDNHSARYTIIAKLKYLHVCFRVKNSVYQSSSPCDSLSWCLSLYYKIHSRMLSFAQFKVVSILNLHSFTSSSH